MLGKKDRIKIRWFLNVEVENYFCIFAYVFKSQKFQNTFRNQCCIYPSIATFARIYTYTVSLERKN